MRRPDGGNDQVAEFDQLRPDLFRQIGRGGRSTFRVVSPSGEPGALDFFGSLDLRSEKGAAALARQSGANGSVRRPIENDCLSCRVLDGRIMLPLPGRHLVHQGKAPADKIEQSVRITVARRCVHGAHEQGHDGDSFNVHGVRIARACPR